MKNEIFRPVDFWKSAVMSMPDNSFFELLRSVFGKIKTPFNKQQLLNNLESFLLREDIQKTIISYIDENDAKIIAAIAVYDEPVIEQLGLFFYDEFSYAKLQDIIVNLEERFIIYRFHSNEEKTNQQDNKPGCCRLALNPVLKTLLLKFTSDSSVLFPSFQKQPPASKTVNSSGQITNIIFSDLILAGFLSFVSQWKPFYKNENSNKGYVIRKRVYEAGKSCFSGIDLDNFTGSLLVLGLFYIDESNLTLDKKRINDFVLLSARERCEYFTAAYLIYKELPPCDEILSPLYKNKIRETANLIHGFLDLLKEDNYYPENTLRRLIEVSKAHTGININVKLLIETLEATGLILITTDKSGIIASPAAKREKEKTSNTAVIAIDSGFSILVYPEIEFADAITLASFLNIHETSSQSITPVVRFDLNKESIVRAFDNNLTADEIILLLDRLLGAKTNLDNADNTLVWNLKDWEKQYQEVSLKKGIVMSLSEKHRYLAETNPLSTLIIETFAPGLYMIDENSIEEAKEALNNAGIEIIAQRHEKKEKNTETFTKTFFVNHFPSPVAIDSLLSTFNTKQIVKTKKDNHAAVQTAAFLAVLKDLKLSETEKAELSARINRRLILCETQLKEANIRYEKLEARHMDYTGKQTIAKQAISQQSPVEIIRQGKGSSAEGEKIFGIPKALEKEGNELFLIIDPGELQESNKLQRIPLAKISLLRRIKKSIFEK